MSHADNVEDTRRDFIYHATGTTGAVAGGAAVWPLIDNTVPEHDVFRDRRNVASVGLSFGF